MSEWSHDPAFWQTMYPVMFPPQRQAASDAEVAAVLDLSNVRKGAVLDMCCGPGRHALSFAKRGFEVTGVDCTRFLLDQARASAVDDDQNVEWIEDDMRSFVRERSFDLAVNLFMSFGYSDSRDDDLRALSNLRRSLRPGGVLVLDVVGKEVLARIFRSYSTARVGPDTLLVRHNRLSDDWSRVHNQWTVVCGEDVVRRSFSFTVYSGSEMKQLMLEAGFASVALFGSWSGAAYDHEAVQMIAVARAHDRS